MNTQKLISNLMDLDKLEEVLKHMLNLKVF